MAKTTNSILKCSMFPNTSNEYVLYLLTRLDFWLDLFALTAPVRTTINSTQPENITNFARHIMRVVDSLPRGEKALKTSKYRG